MRNAKEVLEEITNWAEKNDDVRAVMLTGSRANTNSTVDLLSDYDIEIAVNNVNQFLNNEQWLSVFGDILTIIRIDESFTLRMVLYKDYVRIDFRIHSVENFKQYVDQHQLPENWDTGYILLSDKDGLTANLKQPGNKVFVILKPSAEEFLAIVTDFWWDTTYVAKSLWRNEIFYAKYMADNIIRFSYLQKIVEWYIGLQYDWNVTTNKHGRFFRRFLDSTTWTELENTFSGSGTEANWNSLFATIKLFRRLSAIIAKELRYPYPDQLDGEITTYLEKIRKLDRGARDIS